MTFTPPKEALLFFDALENRKTSLNFSIEDRSGFYRQGSLIEFDRLEKLQELEQVDELLKSKFTALKTGKYTANIVMTALLFRGSRALKSLPQYFERRLLRWSQGFVVSILRFTGYMTSFSLAAEPTAALFEEFFRQTDQRSAAFWAKIIKDSTGTSDSLFGLTNVEARKAFVQETMKVLRDKKSMIFSSYWMKGNCSEDAQRFSQHSRALFALLSMTQKMGEDLEDKGWAEDLAQHF